MYDYYKMILEKVHFEPKIFRKELRKALNHFNSDEKKSFLEWCKEKFKKKEKSIEIKLIAQSSK
jgi:hypothetical protein